MKIYLPSNLNLESTVSGYNKKHKEKYQWMIHTIVHQSYKTKSGINNWVNLDKTLLRKYLGERYCNEIINQLEKSGIIKVNGAYSATNFSMSYKLTDSFSNSTITSIDFKGNKAFRYVFKINDYNKQLLEKHLKDETINQLYQNVFKIEIDKPKALKHTAFLQNSGEINIEKFSVGLMSIENISSKDENYFFTIDEKTGRAYHPIANCPRYLRQFLSYQGQKLHQIDIANSQPMLFYLMIVEYYKEMKAKKANLLRYTTTYTYDISNIQSPYVETFSGNEYPADVIRFIKLCSIGQFYEDLMREFDIPQSEDARQEFKKTFFGQIFYSELNSKWEYHLAKKFKKIYPNLYAIIQWYKRINHADLPLKLQKIESDIVIKGVCGKIVKENNSNSMPFFCTVHDCIICLEKDVNYIKTLLEEELKAVMGFVPKVKTSLFA